jgi:uncharacterized protein (TIGR00299 family) protein
VKTAYLDCFSGISGNMLLGACVDSGAPLDGLCTVVDSIGVPGITITAEKVMRMRISGTNVRVEIDEDHPHRKLADVVELVNRADVSKRVKDGSVRVFQLLAEAEARVHGKDSPEKAVFHEVGALDAVVDVMGSLWCLEALGVERVTGSPVHVGSGTVKCRHGLMPVPAPATAYLLEGVPVYSRGVKAELVTPTGAALLKHLAAEFGPVPAMIPDRIGFGCGDRDLEEHPNCLRLYLGEAGSELLLDQVVTIETNIDDMSPEVFDHLFARCFETGAVDVFIEDIQMKKNRPAWKLSVLAPPVREEALSRLLLAETSTFGVRSTRWDRRMLKREIRTVETDFGPVQVKVGSGDGIFKASPEYEDCRKRSAEAKVPILDVYRAAQAAAEKSIRRDTA